VSREGLRVREVSNEEGNRLLRIVRRSSGSVVTWRRAQMVLLSVQGMDVAGIAKVTFTSPDRVRAVLNNFNYDIAEGKAGPGPGDPTVVFSMDEFAPLNLLPRAGKQWAPVVRRRSKGSTSGPRRRRLRATYSRTKGVRHLLAALDMNADKLYGHIKTDKKRTTFLAFCRYLCSLYPPEVRIAIVCDNFSPHLSTKKDSRVGDWAAANNVELAYVPTNASYLNRIECHFTALRYFALNGTDHRSHDEQNSMIRRYIAWRNRNRDNDELRAISLRAKVA
jgi:hypothetical protein